MNHQTKVGRGQGKPDRKGDGGKVCDLGLPRTWRHQAGFHPNQVTRWGFWAASTLSLFPEMRHLTHQGHHLLIGQ
jgi:hypothetical protein